MMTEPIGMSRHALKASKPERQAAVRWLNRELTTYADVKWDENPETRPGHDLLLREQGCGPESFWFDQITQYLKRASVLGLDNPLGRQAVMKGFATYLGLCESMIRTLGDPPPAGVPSGELR